MNRAEAVNILHEILDILGESVMINSVSLDCAPRIDHTPSGFYEIKLGCELNSQSKERLRKILDKHKLLMRENKGIVAVYRHHSQ